MLAGWRQQPATRVAVVAAGRQPWQHAASWKCSRRRSMVATAGTDRGQSSRQRPRTRPTWAEAVG